MRRGKRLNEAVVSGEAWASAVEKLVQYGPHLLGFLGMTGLGTLFATGLTALHGHGWGIYPIAGLALACIVTVCGSIGLISWRKFRPFPLPANSMPIPDDVPADGQAYFHAHRREPEPMPPTSAKDMLAYDRERRLQLLDTVGVMLRKDFPELLNDGSQILRTWRPAIEQGRRSEAIQQLQEYYIRSKEKIDQFLQLRNDNRHYQDIFAALEMPFHQSFWESLNMLELAIKALPDPLSGDWPYLMALYSGGAHQNMTKLNEWIEKTRPAVAKLRASLTT